MIELPKRTAAEFITLYQVESSLRDLFVEGPNSRVLLAWLCKQWGLRTTVYEIGDVDLPSDWLPDHGGNRDRLCSFAQFACVHLDVQFRNVTCVIDVDFSAVDHCHNLLYTEFPDLLAYFFEKDTLTKLLTFIGLKESDHEAMLASIVEAVHCLCAFHVANLRLGWQMSKVSIDSNLRVSRGVVELDSSGLAERYLLANGRFKERAEFYSVVEDFLKVSPGDDREKVRAHDLLPVMLFIFRTTSSAKLGPNESLMRRIIMITVDSKRFAAYRLSRQIIARLT